MPDEIKKLDLVYVLDSFDNGVRKGMIGTVVWIHPETPHIKKMYEVEVRIKEDAVVVTVERGLLEKVCWPSKTGKLESRKERNEP